MRSAVITGVTGQDGAYLAKHLLDIGYRVWGAFRRTSTLNDWRLREVGVLNHPHFKLVEHDLTDLSSSIRLLKLSKPDEIYNLAAQSFVAVSFDQPRTTAEITALGALNLLEALRLQSPESKFYQASTSEMFGLVQSVPQNEETGFYPRSPYGVSKLFAHWSTVNYRESFSLFASSGILFNHESPLRGLEFVTRKISSTVSAISRGHAVDLSLGNLDAKRDWGFAGDYVDGMHKILQAPKPGTFVLATGVTTTVRDFVAMCFQAAGFDLEFEGEGSAEIGRDKASGKTFVKVAPEFYRPAEVDLLLGDPSKAKAELGWTPSMNVAALAELMVKTDLDRVHVR